MLHEFVHANRDEIIARTRDRVEGRPWPAVSPRELEHGVPLFLTQLSETLRLEATNTPFPTDAIGATAAKHGAELLAAGFNVSQVVHDYGDICQVITDLAMENRAPVTVEEFHILNRSLDTAIAEAVTEYARITAEKKSAGEVERLGSAAHELRDILNSALLAFHMLRRGTVAINGSTGEVLGRSLMGLRDVIDRTLSEVRLDTGKQRRDRIPVTAFVDEIAATGVLHAEYRHIQFTVEPVDPSLAVEGDAHLLTSAVMNMLHNAFKETPAGGRVVLRACARDRRLVVEVEDQCGGISEGKEILSGAADLSVARKAMKAHDGDIQIRHVPGKGCVFVMEMPLADSVPAPQSAA